MFKAGTVSQEPRSLSAFLTSRFKGIIMRYAAFRGDKIEYLRWLGIKIGNGCLIFNLVEDFSSEPWLIEIGNRVVLAAGVHLITHDGASRMFRNTIPGASKYGNRFGRILIHDESFIGMNTIIMPNVEIGPRSIVGVGSIVTKNVPPGMVYAGVPAKPICTVDEYITHYKEQSLVIKANNREDLRSELTLLLWGEKR